MLYYLLFPLAKYSIVFNVFRYVTFRSIGAFVTSLLFTLIVGPAFIRLLKRKSAVETIDEDVPEKHRIKSGTPTMGGLIIIIALLFSSLFWNIVGNRAILSQRFKRDFAFEGSAVCAANPFHLWTSYVESNHFFHLSKLSSFWGTAHTFLTSLKIGTLRSSQSSIRVKLISYTK